MIHGNPNGFSVDSSITFPLELSANAKVVEVFSGAPNPDPTHCPGSQQAPSAAPGYLCLYTFAFNVARLNVYDTGQHLGQASPFGAFLVAVADSAGVAQGSIDTSGSWAVTAP